MASTSSSAPPCKYDVFISFRGKDTRYGILSHLFEALQRKQINAFLDEELRKGEEISPALLKIIQESSVSIVIFSENYADSAWCLDELVEILKCREESGQIVLPVFYKVDPTEVQDLTGNFGKALAMHGEKGNSQKVDSWKRALMEVSNFAGWDLQEIKYEAKLVEGIVNDVLKKFSDMSKGDDSYDLNLIGIKLRVEEVERLLNEKQIVGIWGMGGIGKTTIAQEVLHRNKNKFDGHCFVENVRKTMTKQSSNSNSLNYSTRRRLKSKKVLIVFDDVEDRNHLKDLAGECDLYGEGSRIIITSRNSLGLSEEGIYEVEKLIDSQGENKDHVKRKLKAFGFYPESGIPRLIEKSLITISNNRVDMHDLLEQMGKDIVNEECKQPGGRSRLWYYEDIDHVLTTETVRTKLINEALIIIIGTENVEAISFWPGERGILKLSATAFAKMCNLRFIEVCAMPNKVLLPENFEFCAQALRCLYWDYYPLESLPLNFWPKNLVELHMPSSNLIQLWNGGDKPLRSLKLMDLSDSRNLIRIPDLSSIAPNLEFLYLNGCKSLVKIPSLQNLSNLVELRMRGSKLIQLWNGGDKPLGSLKLMDLSDSCNLIRIPDLSSIAPNLEFLYLNGCKSLVEIPSLQNLSNLVELRMRGSKLIQLWNGGDKPLGNLKLMDLSYSNDLITIPNLSSIVPNLEFLYLKGCWSLVEIPSLQNLSKLTELYLTGSNKIKDCPEIPCQLVILSLDRCTALESLPSSIGNLKRLEELHLAECSRLVTIPSSIGELKCLEKLFLPNCSNLASLPESIKQLSKLKRLNLRSCERLKSLPGLPSCLELLRANDCRSLESASISFNFLEHDDENEEADRSEHENEEAHKSESEDCKFLNFSSCVKLNKKVMEDVFEAHLLGQKVTLLMAGGEVPERMRYKNKGSSLSFKLDLRHLIAFSFCVVLRPSRFIHFPRFEVDFIWESGNRQERKAFNLYSDKVVANWNAGPYSSDSSHMLLSFNGLRTRFDEECFVKASFCFIDNHLWPEIMECGVHPIYRRDKRRSRNEKHQDD
ncbi:disease resistance protein RUN1 [Hevea brasiliensis]|uniref:disease resistance protein RUN1 n=1 Tax=Hevea brasiliensis TaxID=3981 RepID=UPI0025D989D0|nr:disease resistance protein RUN1 [Hevea brasiliensis]